MHVRLQTWFPLTIQICVNGHSWLAHELDKAGIGYRRIDNGFLQIDDCERAQKLADRFIRKKWPRILEAFARKVNPLLKDTLQKKKHYWVIDQSEFATDIMFRDRNTLSPVFQVLLRWAILCFSAKNVMAFLGRKLHGNFQGEVRHGVSRPLAGCPHQAHAQSQLDQDVRQIRLHLADRDGDQQPA